MDKPKITIDQLKNYLGTDLKCKFYQGGIMELCAGHLEVNVDSLRPICYRLSDLDKFIPELGFVPIQEFETVYGGNLFKINQEIWKNFFLSEIISLSPDGIQFRVAQNLFQWNFWPFGEEYFEQGLVIDKLTHGKEVSNG